MQLQLFVCIFSEWLQNIHGYHHNEKLADKEFADIIALKEKLSENSTGMR